MNKKIERVLEIFEQINNIPRKSKNEETISKWLYDWALQNGFEAEQDSFLDILVKVPATPGYENYDTVVFQGHMDMVCEKVPESTHNFLTDPIVMYQEDGWLKARETSLGADNGIALAISMALATDPDIKHPPLELLYTVDEETGLTGAVNLEPGWVSGKKLIHIDSEDEGVFTIGCAGGRDAKITLPKDSMESNSFDTSYEISIEGLKGGHSGVEIDQEKGNSNIMLARVLKNLDIQGIQFGIASINGGTAHNAIPRNSKGIISFNKVDLPKLETVVKDIKAKLKDEYKISDPGVNIVLNPCELKNVLSNKKIVDLILALPNGVIYNSMEMKGIVETSSNVAVIKTTQENFELLMSQRSSVMSRLDEICNKIDSIVKLSGGSVVFGGGYPSWQPDFDSQILKDLTKCYNEIFNREPIIEVIHAGLECGVIGAKYPGMEMISIGPTIKSPHCPDEKMLISTVGDIWKLLSRYLENQ